MLTAEQHTRLSETTVVHQGDTTGPVVAKLARRYIAEPVLDAGAGSGAMIRCLLRLGYIGAVGLDISPKHPLIRKGNIADLKNVFAGCKFRTIIAMDVLEHLDDNDYFPALQSISESLQLGGHLIITTDNNEDMSKSITTCPDCGFRFHKDGHCRSMNLDLLTEQLNAVGLDVIEAKVMNLSFSALVPGALWFYKLGLNRFIDNVLINKSLFIVARKIKENQK